MFSTLATDWFSIHPPTPHQLRTISTMHACKDETTPHTHDWPKASENRKFRIKNCETACGWCTDVLSSPWALRRHAYRIHINPKGNNVATHANAILVRCTESTGKKKGKGAAKPKAVIKGKAKKTKVVTLAAPAQGGDGMEVEEVMSAEVDMDDLPDLSIFSPEDRAKYIRLVQMEMILLAQMKADELWEGWIELRPGSLQGMVGMCWSKGLCDG
jgi:hypothetical protein